MAITVSATLRKFRIRIVRIIVSSTGTDYIPGVKLIRVGFAAHGTWHDSPRSNRTLRYDFPIRIEKRGITMRAWIIGIVFGGMALAANTTSSTSVTYNKDVLPILQKNCQGCHRPGQVAPMSFLTYAEVRPWAKAMKVAVLSKKMPPWFADPQYGHFINDRSLKLSDIETIAKWVDIDTRTDVYSLGIIFYELLLSSPDDSACSGLIYSGVPISAPTRVNIVSAVSFWVSAFGPGAS